MSLSHMLSFKIFVDILVETASRKTETWGLELEI